MIIKLKWFILPIIVSGFFMLNCSRDFSTTMTPSFRSVTSVEKQLLNESEKFGFKLLKEIQSSEPDTNIFISPLSISIALGMTFNGAAGETADAIKNTVGFDGMSKSDINESYASLIALLTEVDPQTRFQIANSIWYRLGFAVEQDFIDINQNYFDAVVSGLDFASPSAVETINSWVNDKTFGNIDKIIDQINRDTVMFLINAMYFNGTWKFEFDKNLTRSDHFYKTDGSKTNCKMMKQQNDFAYYSTSDYQVIDLPYGNGQFRMTVILPEQNKSLYEFITNLNSQTLADITAGLSKAKGTLYLPKFKIGYEKNLNDVLKSLGMTVAFTAAADFSNINKEETLLISQVKHKAYVDVNEEGTEASAVTVVEIGRTSAGGEDPGFIMRVDRPFLFMIRENHSQSILFTGKIVNPGE